MAEHIHAGETRVRQRLIEHAIVLLGQGVSAADLLEATADASGCSVDQVRRFFGRGEDLVLALYLRLASDLADRAGDLPDGGIAVRFRGAMLAKIDILRPYRAVIGSLLATLLNPTSELSVFNAQTEIVRERVVAVVSTVVLGADDCPSSAETLIRTLYAVHLALMFHWSQDRSADAQSTRAAIDRTCDILDRFSGRLDSPAAVALLSTTSFAFERFVGTTRPSAVSETASSLLEVLFRHRRLAEPHDSCLQCLAPHRPLAARSIAAGEPMHLILPAFPAKSPSKRKVLGVLPDKAEEMALEYLSGVCDEIKSRYHPGVRLTICSDGHVFSDLVGVDDDIVTAYGTAIANMIGGMDLASIDTFDMGDVFDGGDYHSMRAELCRHYAEPLEAIVERCQTTPSGLALFNGIHRFLVEDRTGVEPEKSKTQIRKEAKERTYEVIRRSDAWGRLLADCFPTALRLSIHPHPPHSAKIGILLGPATDVWLTPWHAAALKQSTGEFVLMHRHAAEELGAHVVDDQERPYYLEIG